MKFKKAVAAVIAAAMCLAAAPAVLADGVGITVNGQQTQIQAQIIDNYTFVPMKDIFSAIGAEVVFNSADGTLVAAKDNHTVALTLGSTTAYLGNDAVSMDKAPVLSGDEVFVPLRFVAEALSASVRWIAESRTVAISTDGTIAGNQTEPPKSDFVPNPGPETFVKASCTADSYVQKGANADKNFGSAKTLDMKASSEDGYQRIVFLRFDTSALTDANITNAKIELYCDDAQDLSSKTRVAAYAIDGLWDESTVTYNNMPKMGEQLGFGYVIDAKYHEIDITAYMREQVAAGAKSVTMAVYDAKKGDKRVNFYSRETDKPPYLNIKYGGTEEIIEEATPNFTLDIDPVKYAEEILASSKATGNAASSAGTVKVSDSEYNFAPAADAYIRNDEYADQNFGGESALASKAAGSDKGMSRRTYMRFDISEISESTVGGAFLKLRTTTLQDSMPQTVSILKVADNSWDENKITWNNAPKASGEVTSLNVNELGKEFYFDITSYVNSTLASGKKVFSFTVEDTKNQNLRLEFGSKESTNAPVLVILSPGAKGGSVKNPGAAQQDDSKIKYIEVGVNKNKDPRTNYTPTKTRILSSLTDYTPVKKELNVTVYGGNKDLPRQTATGFYYTKKIENRWWMIDPEGYPMIDIGLVAMSVGSTDREMAGLKKMYGTKEDWADKFTAYIRDEIGYNTAGAWSTTDLLFGAKQPFPSPVILNFVVTYADNLGTSVQQSGHKGFINNTMPVFDPGFVTHCDKYAEQLAKYADNPYMLGYFSDNELPCDEKMLDNYLNLDTSDVLNLYSYNAAWTWFKSRHGENCTIADISGSDRDDFREFVYDRYFDVVSSAIKKYDPNHMYFGSRFWNNAKTSQGMWRAAGRYCDAVSLNYYSAWSPSQSAMSDWEKWSGKPLLVTEWYTKAMDSGLANHAGAGWIVPTQKDRGYFYQNFAMGLLESGTCVGWHWFKYHDNDPTAPASDPSNVDGNKGIINPDYKEYTDLTKLMKEFNANVYGLIEYFDAKKK